MMEVIRSLPQGMIWYPLLLLLAIILGRALWSVVRKPATQKNKSQPAVNPLESLQLLVNKAQSDWYSRLELERRCIGLLLQTSGNTGYSVENCRRYASEMKGTAAARLVEEHLAMSEQGALQRTATRADHTNYQDRIVALLELIEGITEEPGG